VQELRIFHQIPDPVSPGNYNVVIRGQVIVHPVRSEFCAFGRPDLFGAGTDIIHKTGDKTHAPEPGNRVVYAGKIQEGEIVVDYKRNLHRDTPKNTGDYRTPNQAIYDVTIMKMSSTIRILYPHEGQIPREDGFSSCEYVNEQIRQDLSDT
jgi:hypothetical protein